MYYFEYPKIDATIYEGSVTSSINTGLDQILEINKNMSLDVPAPKPDIVLGKSRIDDANITGITPAVLILRGKCELWPP